MLASSWLVDGQLGLIPVAYASFGYRCAISALMAWSTTLRASTEPSALNTWVRALQALMTRGGTGSVHAVPEGTLHAGQATSSMMVWLMRITGSPWLGSLYSDTLLMVLPRGIEPLSAP